MIKTKVRIYPTDVGAYKVKVWKIAFIDALA
jgi:hypothetical protein